MLEKCMHYGLFSFLLLCHGQENTLGRVCLTTRDRCSRDESPQSS